MHHPCPVQRNRILEVIRKRLEGVVEKFIDSLSGVEHLLFHEDLFGETKGELLREAGKIAPLQRKGGESSPPSEKSCSR